MWTTGHAKNENDQENDDIPTSYNQSEQQEQSSNDNVEIDSDDNENSIDASSQLSDQSTSSCTDLNPADELLERINRYRKNVIQISNMKSKDIDKMFDDSVLIRLKLNSIPNEEKQT